MKSIVPHNNEALQVGKIDPSRLDHVCQYARWPCGLCCYLQGKMYVISQWNSNQKLDC